MVKTVSARARALSSYAKWGLPISQSTLDRIHIGLELKDNLSTSGVNGPARPSQPLFLARPARDHIDPVLMARNIGIEWQGYSVVRWEIASDP